MIIQFSVKNFLSIKSEQTLNLCHVDNYQELPNNPHNTSIPLVKSLAIFGDNNYDIIKSLKL